MDPGTPLLLRIRLQSNPDKIYECLTSDREREKFWVEKSIESDGGIFLLFPNGQKQMARIISDTPGKIFEIEYFGSYVKFEIFPQQGKGCILQLSNDKIPAADWCEQYAGWVSVLMALKGYADYGIDLRNHHPDYSWDQHYIDN